MNKKRARYAASLALVTAMVAAAGLLGEQEVVFPEIAALAAGMWVIDKQVWRIGRRQTVWMMTLAAVAGWLIARCPGLPVAAAIAVAFLFAAGCQVLTRTSLAPMLSACLLPVVLGADSAVYPIAVLVLTLCLSGGQLWMEHRGWRGPLPAEVHAPQRGRECLAWLRMFAVLMLLAAVPLTMGFNYVILPPLIVTFVEFSRPGTGLHKASGTIYLLLVAAALLGAGCRYTLCIGLGLPAAFAALAACACLFALFEWRGRIFAPAGAVVLIPLLIPAGDLFAYPPQVAAGAAVFMAAGWLLAREKPSPVSAD